MEHTQLSLKIITILKLKIKRINANHNSATRFFFSERYRDLIKIGKK